MLQRGNPLKLLPRAALACCLLAQPSWARVASPRGAAGAGRASCEAVQPIGYISIRCGVSRMAFTLDGAPFGRCPVDSAAVAPGPHLLRGWPIEGRKFSAAFITRRVFVGPGAESAIDLSGVRWVRVETEPFGAAVTRAGVPLGGTPLVVGVSPGDPPLIVEKKGYRVAALAAGSLLSGPSPTRLELEPARREGGPEAPAALEPVGRTRLDGTTVLLGVAVVTAAASAAVLNKQADDAFEAYRTTGNIARMNDRFRRAEKLDSWAVASWITSEAALGLFIYRLLRERNPRAAQSRTMEGTPR